MKELEEKAQEDMNALILLDCPIRQVLDVTSAPLGVPVT